MKKLLLFMSVLISNTLMAQSGMDLGCTDCVMENRWQSNQYINWSNGNLVYTFNSSGNYPTSQIWEFEHVNNEPANIFRIKNNSGYIVRTTSGITIQSTPGNNEDSHWEVLVRNGFYFILAPCELKGLHLENLNGTVEFDNISMGWHSAQWILKDAFNPLLITKNIKKSRPFQDDRPVAKNIGAKVQAGKKAKVMSDLKQRGKSPAFQLSKNLSVTMKVNASRKINDSITIFGGTSDVNPDYTFQLYENKGKLKGTVVSLKNKRAFEIKEEGSGLISEEVDIEEVMCIGMPEGSHDGPVTNMTTRGCDIPANTNVYQLNSQPGATAVIYLDFDGEYVEHPWWNGGDPIDAQPMQISEGWIYAIWQGIVEDFMPFNVTVTTDVNVYNAAPLGRKTQVIFTSTNFTTYGGVAYLNTFNNSVTEIPCWVFNDFSPQGIWDTGSHEIGHTLGISHDGRTTPSEDYYAGHQDWGPIMGWSVDRQLSQWSLGEYQNANNTEDDIAIITKAANHITTKADDISSSRPLNVSTVNGNVQTITDGGLIETRNDVDRFTFTLSSPGEVHLDIIPPSVGPNLNIGVRILSGTQQITSYNPDGPENYFFTNLPAGSYILEIDGVGERDPLTTGYSDYASIGSYTINGTIESGGTSTNLLSVFNVPAASGIPNGFKQYSYVHTIGSSTANLSNVFNSVFNWWGGQNNPNGLYQFTLETSNGQPRHYTNLTDYSTYTLHTAGPEININSSTGFAGLGGNYWVTFHNNNLVLVAKSGDYALYFSNSATPPTLPGASARNGLVVTEEQNPSLVHPNPFNNAFTIDIPSEMGSCVVNIADMSGMLIESFTAVAGKLRLGENYKPGFYNVSISGVNATKQFKVLKF